MWLTWPATPTPINAAFKTFFATRPPVRCPRALRERATFQLSPQSLPRQSESTRRARAVAPRLAERLVDARRLDAGQLGFERRLGLARARRPRDASGQRGDADRAALAGEHRGMRHRLRELANIARPGMRLDRRARAGVEPGARPRPCEECACEQ
jgi:hypothetical protein